MGTSKADIYSDYYKAKRLQILQKVEKYPSLYWALRWHRNDHNQEMSFENAHYLLDLYKNIHKLTLMVTRKAVQMGWTELFIVDSHREASQGLTVAYILPKFLQRNKFVANRINRLHRRAGFYANQIRVGRQEGGTANTAIQHFGKGTLLYIGSNVSEEFIETPWDASYVDEKDHCNLVNLRMVSDRLTNSQFGYQREVGNPTIEGFGIDERYQSSTQGIYVIKCDHCNTWFEPDFFLHLVELVDVNRYKVRDSLYKKDNEVEPSLICLKCGKPVDRWKKGEWIHAFPNRDWAGFTASELISISPQVTMRELAEAWTNPEDQANYVVGNASREQLFINNKLGKAYSSKGARIQQEELDLCKRNYLWSELPQPAQGPRTMGIDVGSVLHVVIRERVSRYERKLVGAFVVPTFEAAGELITKWKPKVVVVDAHPELHKVVEFQAQFKNVWASEFLKDSIFVRHVKRREVKQDRTALLDFVHAGISEQLLWLPMLGEGIRNGMYYAHLMASTRILEEDEENPDKNRFVWVHTKPDHFFLAEAYCMQADFLLPDSSLFDYYRKEATLHKSAEITVEKIEREVAQKDPHTLTKEERFELAKYEPSVFLEKKSKLHTQAPTVQVRSGMGVEDEIANLARDLLAGSKEGRVEIRIFEQRSGLRGESAIKFLTAKGFVVEGDSFHVSKD